jgi:serine/threonine protein kinase
MLLVAGEQVLPDYRLIRRLGKGGFAEVWEAKRGDGQRRALKFLDCRSTSRELISGEVRMLRSLQELRHPNILRLEEVQARSHYLILVMERADGSLADLRKTYQEVTGGNIPPAHMLELLEQAADALDFLAEIELPGRMNSSRGVQHCDIKPSNLLLLGDCLKVADFGLAGGSNLITHRGGWKGTIPYAAPELFKGYAARGTDQFALAVTACELIMGARPFQNNSVGTRPPDSSPIDLTRLRQREFPVFARALHPQPDSRWPSCRAFVSALREAIDTPRTEQNRFRVRLLEGGLGG